jgi:hypothetical protein
MSCPHSPIVTHDAGLCPAVRPELAALPRRLKKLSVDARGYPIPWFVAWLDGAPEFRAMDPGKWALAVRERLCWVCGDPMGKFITFVLGPMCGVNRTTSEPACHLDCAEWSAQNCPFLARPHMVRRDMDPATVEHHDLNVNPAGIALTRNPGVTLLWTTHTFRPFRVDGTIPGAQAGLLIHVGDPLAIRAYRAGQAATREDVDESIANGLPALRVMAESGGAESIAALNECVVRLARTLDLLLHQP